MAVCAQADCEQLLSLLQVVCLQAEFENLLALFVRLCGDEIWGVRKVRARNRGCNNHSNNSRHNSRNDRGRSGDGSTELLLFSTVSARRSQLQACAEALPAVAVLVPAERRATEFAALFYAFTADVSRWVKRSKFLIIKVLRSNKK